MNCIQEEIILTKYFEKTTKKLHQASGTRLNIGNKISNTHICNDVIYSQSILKKQLKNYTKLVEQD
jgi:predicted flavoprotein YhiN